MEERIQKIIAAAGVVSRRAAEQLILEGRVRVNGQVVTELGSKADAAKDHIKVDGKLINPHQPPVYIMLNKPAGFVTTMADPEGRPTVQNLLKGVKQRVYPVGRLDYNTEGLLLLTNDGDFAHLITHPKHELPKTYRVKVKGVLEDRQIEMLETGIYLDDGRTAPAKVRKISKEESNSWLDITIHEGRKRQVRRMFDRTGHSVIKLKRTKIGNLTLGDLPEGAFRHLDSEEIRALKEYVEKESMPEVQVHKEVEQTKPAEQDRSIQHDTVAKKPATRPIRGGDSLKRHDDRREAPGRRSLATADRRGTDSRPQYARSAEAPKRYSERATPGRRPSSTIDRRGTDSRPQYARSAETPKRYGEQRMAPGRGRSAAGGRPQRDGRTQYARGTEAPRRYGDRRAMQGRGPAGGADRSRAEGRPGTSRVAGQGASGRGLRRPPREAGSFPTRGNVYPNRSAARPEINKTFRKSTGPRSAATGAGNRESVRKAPFRSVEKKPATSRVRGKVFDANTDRKLKTEWKPRSSDRAPRPSAGRPKSTVFGGKSDNRGTRRPGR